LRAADAVLPSLAGTRARFEKGTLRLEFQSAAT